MKRDVLMLFPHVQMTCFALLLFFISFVSVVVYSFHAKNKVFFSQLSKLPLEED